MKRMLAALLALCVLALAGCAKQNPPAEPAPSEPVQSVLPDDPGAPPPEEPEPDPFEGVNEITCGELVVPIPYEYAELVLSEIEPEAWSEHWTPLVSFSEIASVEAGKVLHPDEDWGDGWLCTILRLDRIGFEEWASGESVGTRLFARNGEDAYYLLAQPTDVRLARETEEAYNAEATLEQWTALNNWADGLSDDVIARNGLSAYDASDLFGVDYTYGGEHVELGCRFPGEPMDLAILSLSQPVRQGEGGVWCVERIRFVYSNYNWTDTQLVYPAALGIDMTAADYYAQLQSECDAGNHPELLTPEGAALDYASRVPWMFGEDVSATDFERIEAVG